MLLCEMDEKKSGHLSRLIKYWNQNISEYYDYEKKISKRYTEKKPQWNKCFTVIDSLSDSPNLLFSLFSFWEILNKRLNWNNVSVFSFPLDHKETTP